MENQLHSMMKPHMFYSIFFSVLEFIFVISVFVKENLPKLQICFVLWF